ncbi:hypothetical protein NGA79_00930 [Lactococcus garvieae]|nr:hypothetical protein [Lactococcus garvieae]MDG6190583.1 hypothetical protein [Lactococcus garvieae]
MAGGIGDFWVVDHTTGWAYWASLLEPGNASSYLLDAAELTEAIEDTVFNGSYYYGIHVDSQLISPDNSEEFLPGGDSRLEAFLTGIKNNSMNETGTSNPRYEVDSPPSDFNFDTMLPGRVFTMAGEEYLYLEQQGADHLIIRHEAIRNTSFNDQPQVLSNWFSGLDAEVRAMVQPVSIPAVVPGILASIGSPGVYGVWLPPGWVTNPVFDAVRADRTAVSSSGTPQAFALSLADVIHLSTEAGPFPNTAQRVAARNSWWWLRTPAAPDASSWLIHRTPHVNGLIGTIFLDGGSEAHRLLGGVRPALIIHQ